jgi:rhodanese-related sulfurtransferase
VLGCQVGGRSFRACEILEQVGYTNLADQRAGFGGARDFTGRLVEPGWLDAGLPVEAGPGGEGQSYSSLMQKER